jgi:hypothetical protein
LNRLQQDINAPLNITNPALHLHPEHRGGPFSTIHTMTQTSTRVPAALQDRLHAIGQAAAGFQARFSVGASTCCSRAREVRKALGLHRMAPGCALPEKQEMALAQGFVAYAPGRKEAGA